MCPRVSITGGVLALTLAAAAALAPAPGAVAQMQNPLLGSAGRASPPHRLTLHGTHGIGASCSVSRGDYPGVLLEPASAANYTASDRGLGDINRIVIHVGRAFLRPPTSGSEPARRPPLTTSFPAAAGWRYGARADLAWRRQLELQPDLIGIEHAGYTNLTHFPDAQYRASAHLAASIARRYLMSPSALA